MCMQVYRNGMRTTVEITDDQRAKLLELAAQRGEKGFSRLVQEAIDGYLERNQDRQERIRAAISVLGTVDDETAEELRRTARELRQSWR
jgi:metal-responsive CopG/Arc/MetJ family transcriptional regulator